MAQALEGKVIDYSTRAPLSRAHVVCPESGEATVSDIQGNFRLLLKDRGIAKRLVASHIGYQSFGLRLSSNSPPYVFELIPDTTQLKTVEVTSPDPVELLNKAILSIEDNHGGARLLTCFYRMETRNEGKYIQISEAAFELNQRGQKYNQLRVLRAREAEDERAFNGVGMGIGTPVSAAKNFDVTLNVDQSFLSKKNLRKHTFFYEGISKQNGVEVHEISFDQKDVKESLYHGKIFLETESLAFVAIEYGLSPKGIAHFKVGNAAERAAMKLLDIDIDLYLHEEKLSYRKFGRKWFPDHAERHEKVRVKSRRYNFDVPVDDRNEFLVTSIDTSVQEPFPDEILLEKGFIEAASDNSDAFWKDHNIIPSKVKYEDIARGIEARNGYTSIKTAIKEKLKDFPKDASVRADSIISFYHKSGLFNGTALVKFKGKVILHKGYGYADRERKILNDTATIFRIGSIAKTFTSRIIWELEQNGVLHYRDSVQRFVPWFPHHNITIHHLLTHSSGLTNFFDNPDFIDSLNWRFTTEELIRHFARSKPLFSPGTSFKYSNTGYVLLALIAEKASGKPFEVLFDELITKLNLRQTFFDVCDCPAMATGYYANTKEPEYVYSNTVGAGAVSSTAADLLKWDEAHNNESLKALFEPRTWYHDWGAHYGYGWNIDKYQFYVSKKHTIQYHGGTDFGFKSMLARQPDRDNLVVLLNNTGDFPLFDMTDLLLQIMN